MKQIIGFTIGVALILSMGLISCEKETINTVTECSCSELHEVLEPVNVNGLPTLQWVYDYETPPTTMDCSNATDYYYNANSTERWKTNCY
jgi:hypothetical protein